MADNFDMKKFLAENKLGAYSRLKEEKFYSRDYVTQKYGDKAKEIEDNIQDEEDNNPNIWDLYTSLETAEETDEFVKGFIDEGEAAYEYEKGKAAGEKEEKAKLKKEDADTQAEKMMDFLAEYEVIYVYGSDGKCYRKDDEGNYDEVNDYYCRMQNETKEEGYMGTQYDSSEDMAVDMVKKGITEYEVIYVYGSDGKCYRKDDEGNYDEVNDYYCRMQNETKEPTEEALSSDAMSRMEGLVPQTALKAVMSGTQAIIRDLKQDGFEEDEIFDFIVSKIKTLGESKKPTEEALGGKNPEGDALVLRFLQGVAKKFDYPVAKAAIFVKNTIKSLGY